MIKIEVRVKTCKKVKDDEFGKKGDEFKSYKAFTKKYGWIDLKLTQECEVQELEKNCYLNVEFENVSVDKKRKFPVVWIKKLTAGDIEYIEYSTNVADYFD